MTNKRKVEVFSAGCACCHDTIALVKKIACSSCEVTIHDMNKHEVAERAKHLGIRSVPAVVIDGSKERSTSSIILSQGLNQNRITRV